MINIIIAEDDPYARAIIKGQLNNISGTRIIGEVETGRQLVQMVKELNPEVIFLDIEMPEMNGLDAAKEIFNLNPKMFIVFATAYDNFAHEAFQVYAFDYLIKPFEPGRIKQTVHRIQKLMSKRNQSGALVHQEKPQSENIKLSIQSNQKTTFIDIKNIIMITRSELKTFIYTIQGTFPTYEALKSIEDKLKGDNFFRCHKGYIINAYMVTEILFLGNKAYQVKLANTDETALMTLEKAKDFKEKFCV